MGVFFLWDSFLTIYPLISGAPHQPFFQSRFEQKKHYWLFYMILKNIWNIFLLISNNLSDLLKSRQKLAKIEFFNFGGRKLKIEEILLQDDPKPSLKYLLCKIILTLWNFRLKFSRYPHFVVKNWYWYDFDTRI